MTLIEEARKQPAMSVAVESALQPPVKTPWRLVMLLGALTAFAPMSIDMYLPALPTLQTAIGASAAQAQASMAAFFAAWPSASSSTGRPRIGSGVVGRS
jgi:hypothetical protein